MLSPLLKWDASAGPELDRGIEGLLRCARSMRRGRIDSRSAVDSSGGPSGYAAEMVTHPRTRPPLDDVRRLPDAVSSVEYPDVPAFEEADLASGIQTIWYGGLPLDFQVIKGTRPVLVVVFDGALVREKTQLPRFSGGGVTNGLGVSRLSFSDPSLYLSDRLRLAWYAGSALQPELQTMIVRVVRKVVDSLSPERVVFFGASGGGFAALLASSHFADSLAVVVNPQTSIGAYVPRHVQSWLDAAWEGRRLESLPHTVTSDLIRRYSSITMRNYVAYAQNRTDSHVNAHMEPWIAVADPSRIQTRWGSWGEGHVGPPKETITEMLAAAADWTPGATLTDFCRGAESPPAPRADK